MVDKKRVKNNTENRGVINALWNSDKGIMALIIDSWYNKGVFNRNQKHIVQSVIFLSRYFCFDHFLYVRV